VDGNWQSGWDNGGQRVEKVAFSPVTAPPQRIPTSERPAPLIEWPKLDTLKTERAADILLRKACHRLAIARQDGAQPAEEIDQAQSATGTAIAKANAESLLRNLTILERLGCLDAVNMAKLRRGERSDDHPRPLRR
jgi:hypothetical protein